jgi:hypothetical protein
MAEGLLPPPSSGVGDIMATAKAVFRVTLAKGLPLALFAALLYGLPIMYMLAKGKSPDIATYARGGPEDPVFWWLSVLGFAGAQFCSAALLYRQKLMAARTLPQGHEDLRLAGRRLPGLVLAMLPGQFSNSLAFGALYSLFAVGFTPAVPLIFVPAVFLGVCFLVIRPVMMLEAVTPWAAWVRCVRLVQPLWVRAMAAAVFGWLILFVCLLAALALLGVLLSMGAGGVAAAGAAGTPGGVALGPVQNAIAASVVLGLSATGLVYLNAVWLSLHAAAVAHSAASSSA